MNIIRETAVWSVRRVELKPIKDAQGDGNATVRVCHHRNLGSSPIGALLLYFA
jgi:hypothetical protein